MFITIIKYHMYIYISTHISTVPCISYIYNLFVVDFLHHKDFGEAAPCQTLSSALSSLVRTWLTMYSQ